MGKDTMMVALDSNAMTYLITALRNAPQEPKGQLAEEMIALVRSFMYLPQECSLHLTPTVEAEYLRIRNEQLLDDHLSWASVHFCMINPRPDPLRVETRALEFKTVRSGVNDCKLLAECEFSSIERLVTVDRRFRSNLGTGSRVMLISPQELWASLDMLPGAPSPRLPCPTNPLSKADWWRA
jgi:predicted nucleic acid-binding protein